MITDVNINKKTVVATMSLRNAGPSLIANHTNSTNATGSLLKTEFAQVGRPSCAQTIAKKYNLI